MRPIQAEGTKDGLSSSPAGLLLVVDDNNINRIMLSRYLSKLGYQASLAENGRQALVQLQDKSFDLVLSVDYLQQVGRVTAAASAIKANTFQHESLNEVARRPDELGQLAQVFQEMARQVSAREQQLQWQVQQLRIEIDQARKAREVADITESDYFKHPLDKAEELRNRARIDREEGTQENQADELHGDV